MEDGKIIEDTSSVDIDEEMITPADRDGRADDGQVTESAAGLHEADVQPETVRKRSSQGGLKIIAAFAAGFAACIAVFAILTYGAGLGRIIPRADYEYYQGLSDRFGKYYLISQMIDEDPLVDETPDMVTDDSVREMMDSLTDPYAAYYTPEEFQEFTRTYEGDYVGIGIMVEQTEEGLFIMQVYDDGPAQGAGLEPGDQIIRVDGVVPDGIDDAVSRMTGDDGTSVTVTIRRDGKEQDHTMKRAAINLDSVGYAVSKDDPEVGYIRIALFADDTDDELKDAVKDLQGKGCDKFILDLRDNGGGLTDVSIDIADYLLPECRIMTEVTKDGKEKVYDSDKSSADLDLVVLVNENTASASEILTAAIKENDAGTVIGTKTYGKGVTQVTRQFKDGYAVKLTVSEYLTPEGNHVQDKGIEPDIEAEGDDVLDRALEELKD